MTTYDLIVADPPWPETGGGGRGTGKHYETCAWDEIPAVVMGAPVWRPARDYWLGLWATKTSLPYALDIMASCGATYVTAWTWIKTDKQGSLSLGLGQYGRHGVELLLWGKRGTIGRSGDAWQAARADFDAPKGKHSEKPAVAYEQAARVFACDRRLEMFARAPRDGWTVWGNEIEGGTIASVVTATRIPADAPTRERILAGAYDGRSATANVADAALHRALLEAHATATGRRDLALTRDRKAVMRKALEAIPPSAWLRALEGIALDPWWMGTERGGTRKTFDVQHCLKWCDKFSELWLSSRTNGQPAEVAPEWADEEVSA